MIIKDIRTHLLSVPFTDPPKTGFLRLEKIDLLIVDIETDDGMIGTGYLAPINDGLRTLDMCLHEMLRPLLIGADPRQIEQLWQKMWLSTFSHGRMGITVMAMSAIDIALWDLAGKAAGQPLWRLWGGRPDPVPTYGSGCFRGLGHDGMIEKAERFVAQGFDAIKMQVAHLFTHDQDVTNTRDMRTALGPDIKIMIDVNQGWTKDQAIAFGEQIADQDIYWLEEPVMADDFDGYHQIADAISTPLAGGENNFTTHDFKPFFQAGKVAFLQPDIMRGGYTELRRIAKHAEASGQTINPHLFPELSVHLNAAIPNGLWLEYMGWHDHLWVEPLLPVNGTITPPDRPGHGMVFRPDLFRDHAYRP